MPTKREGEAVSNMTRRAEAREKPAPLTEFDIEQWRGTLGLLMHDASLGTSLRWYQERRALATIDKLLAELRDSEEKLTAVKEYGEVLAKGSYSGLWRWQVKIDLDRILEGGK